MTVRDEDELAQRLPQADAVIREGIERQFHSGCQLYVSLDRQPVVDCGIGLSHPDQRMSADTINPWLSAGKPLTAAAILQLWERGLLDLDDRVTTFLPEFGIGGKDAITIRHLLVHTGGFRMTETGWPAADWNEIVRRICESSLEQDWIVGVTAGYHTTSSWFILGEILARQTDQPYADAIRTLLFEPLGLVDTWAAISPDRFAQYGDRIGRMFSRERGELHPLDWHSAERCDSPSPGSNIRGPIRELGRFYEMLLNRGVGMQNQILLPQTVEAMVARHRVGRFDSTLAHVVDFGLGVIIDSNQYGADTVPYGYGQFCSPRAFGHGGAQSSQGWCDPERGIVIAYFFNGRPGEGQHNRRARQLNEAIFRDLGWA